MKKLRVNLKEKSYNIFIDNNLRKSFASHIKEVFKGKKISIITDDNLNEIYGEEIKLNLKEAGFEVVIISMKPGEQSKTFFSLMPIYDKLLDFNLTRSDLIIAFGGGVVGDTAGFIAATFLRGINFVQIPTSLLAQVDSSIGGKVAVDLPKGKNLIGSFYHPKLVLIDTDMLKTLPKKFFYDGLGEVIKYGCIRDKELFYKLDSYKNKEELKENIGDIIFTCCNIKRIIVENDELDTGERMILNFGHTLGHAIEKIYNYEGITHGEGVAIGMYMITKISEKLGLSKSGVSAQIKNILMKYDLPYEVSFKDKKGILDAIKLDKKNFNNKLNVILLKDIGESFIHSTNIDFFNIKTS